VRRLQFWLLALPKSPCVLALVLRRGLGGSRRSWTGFGQSDNVAFVTDSISFPF